LANIVHHYNCFTEFIFILQAVLCQSHNSLISLGSAALAGHAALPRKLAAIYAEEAVKPSKIKVPLDHIHVFML
jgi:hypothetical protein